jgi:hypothetical protein
MKLRPLLSYRLIYLCVMFSDLLLFERSRLKKVSVVDQSKKWPSYFLCPFRLLPRLRPPVLLSINIVRNFNIPHKQSQINYQMRFGNSTLKNKHETWSSRSSSQKMSDKSRQSNTPSSPLANPSTESTESSSNPPLKPLWLRHQPNHVQCAVPKITMAPAMAVAGATFSRKPSAALDDLLLGKEESFRYIMKYILRHVLVEYGGRIWTFCRVGSREFSRLALGWEEEYGILRVRLSISLSWNWYLIDFSTYGLWFQALVVHYICIRWALPMIWWLFFTLFAVTFEDATLKVRVNALKWIEYSNLYPSKPLKRSLNIQGFWNVLALTCVGRPACIKWLMAWSWLPVLSA